MPRLRAPITERAHTGRPRIYCGDRCQWRENQRSWRASHPLGWRMIAELGLPTHSPLAMLRERGVRGA